MPNTFSFLFFIINNNNINNLVFEFDNLCVHYIYSITLLTAFKKKNELNPNQLQNFLFLFQLNFIFRFVML